MYHAKVTDGRTDDQNAVIMESVFKFNGNCHVLLAGVAFGIGINTPDNQRVIHFASFRKWKAMCSKVVGEARMGEQCSPVYLLGMHKTACQ